MCAAPWNFAVNIGYGHQLPKCDALSYGEHRIVKTIQYTATLSDFFFQKQILYSMACHFVSKLVINKHRLNLPISSCVNELSMFNYIPYIT